MSTPILSVVIPVYNYGHLVERAVCSVLSQQMADAEIILVDDGSKDNSAEVCRGLAIQNKNIRFISQQNGGAACARNHGIRVSKGEYLVFLDADDEFCDGAIKTITSIIDARHPDVIIGAHYAKEPGGKIRTHLPGALPASMPDRIKAYLIDKKIRISNGAIVIHRSVFNLGMFPEQFRNSEDIPVFTQALCSEKVIFIEEPLVIVNKHSDSLRHQADLAIQAGMQLVDEIFNEKRLPKQALVWRKRYAAQRALSLMRSCYRAKQYHDALALYRQAIALEPRVFFKWAYTRKAFIALLRRHG